MLVKFYSMYSKYFFISKYTRPLSPGSMDSSSPPAIPSPSCIVVETHDVNQIHNATTLQSLSTKPAIIETNSTDLLTSVATPNDTQSTTSRSNKRRKVSPNPRVVLSETPRPLTEPYAVQTICQGMRKKNNDFPMCMACTFRQFSSGGCKFASLRAFPIDPATNQFTSLTNAMFLNSAPFLGRKQREAIRAVKIPYSTPGTSESVEFIKSCIAPTLASVLAIELVHKEIFRDEGLLRRRREAGVRPVCDGCATTIFSGHFMCCCCGREICLDCYSEWDDSEAFGWEDVDSCSKRRRHTKKQMIPFTLFEEWELERLIKDVKAFPRGRKEFIFQRKFPRDRADGFLPYTKTSVDDITEEDFQSFWGLGQPLVLTGCLDRFQMPWTPDHFIQHYGDQECILVNCNSDKMITSKVGKFFSEFLSTDLKSPLKLKVLPPEKQQKF